jgi:hypothetical protein
VQLWIVYRAGVGRAGEAVDADLIRAEGPWFVLERQVLVIGRFRRVVALRLRGAELQQLVLVNRPVTTMVEQRWTGGVPCPTGGVGVAELGGERS